MTSSYDAIVIGLGGMGSAAAYRLAARGLRVLGLERFTPGHDRGSSHGGSRVTRQAYFEDPAYVPLLLRAADLWEQVERDSGRDIVTYTGGVMIGRPDSRTVAGSKLSAEQWGLAHDMLDAAEIRRRFPTLNPADDEIALYEAMAGFVRPEESVLAHLQLAGQAGAELHFEETVAEWAAEGSGVRVTTDQDTYTAGRLVICPGAWAPDLLAGLGVDFEIERQVMYWFAPEGGTAAFVPESHPVYIWEVDADTQFYGFPAIDGPDGGAKVAMFRGGRRCTPETIDREVHDAEVEAIRTHLRPRIPALPGPLLHAATCMYTNTADEHFVIAAHPAHSQVTVACGFSGHGFKFVPVVGEILADLAAEGSTPHPIALFDPARLLPASRKAHP
ncbi:N-methyl-L-tryptophan oxidase [Actinospica sp. MGRD01-02]|uniref:N-methyl-L-tryptophan oxidase n=1 Tax=Actinospica acidithermotolerans TaxID=2828514 RepID=A0A941E7H3_9ACTN|nr:N-methyl-L-tryptophan oxidase [Actinospica acidithermotolerans]MBR7824845.1 N-methyl-L-tryptophan oxidase [Actinospica acidithermotolerans]